MRSPSDIKIKLIEKVEVNAKESGLVKKKYEDIQNLNADEN